ncbi:hypothetical protein ACLOJK_006983 [Asimina triloba]
MTRRLSQGYVEFLARRDIKGITDSPNCMPGWEARFFFAWLVSKRDIWGVPERWEESLPDPIPRSRLSLPARRWRALMYFRGTTLRWHSSREDRRTLRWPRRENIVLRKECTPRKKKVPWQTPVLLSRELPGLRHLNSQLPEELEVSRAEVTRLQSMLRGDVARLSAMVEYLRSEPYHRRMEFEQAHHSRSRYIRALSEMAALYPELDLSSLYRLFYFMLSTVVVHVSEFPVLG